MIDLYYIGNQELDFDEFCELMSKTKKDVTSYKAIEEAFKVFDKEGKGRLSITFVLLAFSCLCEK
ncbi:hypothetical protein DPMN_086567 [Dreissena polymorpha]|uniref:EF-hand domain-containing protein n=1 Tax=Dreissena polymorpha TaxID=45954 RepID=A0A9D4KRQ5_DREPO|nr:hypothetical protein DPMN_086567 [Dreissena polymorpha]